MSFEYNDEGIRISKTVSGTKHVYRLSGTQIQAEEWGNNLLIYLYDADGSPIGMQYRNDTMSANTFYTFWFEKNLQGDIVAVYNSSGTKCVSYTYDAWGNITPTPHNLIDSNANASLNPFKYRGYYYDTDTGFYYLNSRYYDPATGRFINADDIIPEISESVKGYNLFAYCFNNPINMSDGEGTWPSWATKLIIGTVCAVAAVAITVATAGTGAAAIVPALIAVGKTVAISAATGAALSTISNRVTTGSWEGSGKAALNGLVDGYMWGGIGALGSAGVGALQANGALPKRVKIDKLVNNPQDPYTAIEPKQGLVVEKINEYLSTGKYEYPSVIKMNNGLYEIANGHHTIQALKSLGKKTIKVFITK